MSGPSGQVTQDDIRKEVKSRYAHTLGQRIGDGSKDIWATQIVNEYSNANDHLKYLADLYNMEEISGRTKEEMATRYLGTEFGGANTTAQNSTQLSEAREQASKGFGSEFARVLREKYVQSKAKTPGRMQTVTTGRM